MAETAFPRRGGPPAVDLVNTAIVERGRPRDLLATERDLAAWLALERDRLGLEQVPTETSLADFQRLRQALRETFTAVVRGRRPPAGALDTINRVSAREPIALRLDWPGRGGPRVSRRTRGTRAPDRVGCVNSVTADLQGDCAFAADVPGLQGPARETTPGTEASRY